MNTPYSPSIYPKRRKNFVFGLLMEQWFVLMLISLSIVLFTELFDLHVSWWSAAGIFVSLMILGHLSMTAGHYVAFPGLIAFACCLQLLVSPWLADLFPPQFPLFQSAVSPDEYFSYTVPAVIAFWVGLHWCIRKDIANRQETFPSMEIPILTYRIWDAIIVIGILMGMISIWAPGGFSFVFYIIGSFQFFGALCWMLTGKKGWKLRVGLVLFYLVFRSTEYGVFYNLIHWGGYFLLVYCFRYGWKWRLSFMIIASIFLLGILQIVKQEYRERIESETGLDFIGRVELLGELFHEKVLNNNSPEIHETVGDVLARFNQGWIVSYVLDHVPREVSHANGKTVRDAFIYSIVPRVLDPNKPAGASKSMFSEYTGLPIGRWTSMGLGIIGEMYANFGRSGGIIAVWTYAWFIGYLFSKIFQRVQYSLFWWAILPIVLLPAVEPGFNLEDILNHISKSGLVVFLLIWKVPWLRHLLGLDKSRGSKQKQYPNSLQVG